MNPIFEIFDLNEFLCYTLSWPNWRPLSAERNWVVSITFSHLVPEIVGPKVGLIFHQNLLFNSFTVFCMNFLLDFQSNWLTFSLILDLFYPSLFFLQNLRSDWVQLFYHTLNLANLVKYPLGFWPNSNTKCIN